MFMSKDPAFLFYPGDYLKDTQCLSEKSQVAYDRIMCEHMRNICTDMSKIYVSYEQHTFFTRRLNDDEKTELDFVLKKLPEGVQIEWVAISMAERKAYTESRSKNRTSKKPKKEQNISSTYVKHMVNEDVNENDIDNKDKGKGVGKPLREPETEEVFEALQTHFDISEMNQFNLFRELDSFCMVLQSKKQIPYFIQQFKAYQDYKKKAQEKTHNFKGFIGTIENGFEDGGWCADNWVHKLNNFKENGKQTTDYGKLKADSADRMATIIRKNHGNGNQQPVEGDSGAS